MLKTSKYIRLIVQLAIVVSVLLMQTTNTIAYDEENQPIFLGAPIQQAVSSMLCLLFCLPERISRQS
jgi:hypothetical protein